MESGLLKRYLINLEVFELRCLRSDVRHMNTSPVEFVMLGISDLFPAFLILLVGITLSIGIIK